MFVLIRPKCFNNHERGLNTGSKIMNQPRVESAVGTIQGIITGRPDGIAEPHVVIQHQRQAEPQGRLERDGHQWR